jgi:1-acyl-sn-glycerol-3-phosphate acyltransferase
MSENRPSLDETLRAQLGELSEKLLRPLLDTMEQELDEEFALDPFGRDPEVCASQWPLLKAISAYFATELRGWENVPKGEPVLFVGNHSGGSLTFDPVPLLLKWMEMRGCEDPIYGLAHNIFFTQPTLGRYMRSLGTLPASHENAGAALDKGASVIVLPGGDYEVFRPWAERNKIRFGGRMGFVELAISKGVRVVPMTIHGAHESTLVLTRGHYFAKRIGLDRLRIKTFPIIWNLPFGPTPAFIPSMPLPCKVTVQLGEPLDWSTHPPEDADDPDVVQACYDQITGRMQRTLDALAAERPYPLLSRFLG